MNQPAQDYVEEDNEEVVLNRWGRLKQWWDIGSTLVKVIKWGIMGFKLLFLTSTAAVVVGQAMDEKPLAGMLQEEVLPAEHDHDAILDEILNLQAEVTALEERPEIAGIAGIAGESIVGPMGPPGPPGPPGKSITGPPGKDGLDAVSTSTSDISQALKLHIKGEH